MNHFKTLFVPVLALAVFGAGCAPAARNPQPAAPRPGEPTAVAARQGFGKLPSLQASGSLGTPEALSSRSAAGPAVPAVEPAPAMGMAAMNSAAPGADAMVSSGGGASGVAIARPVPPIPDYRPVSVSYDIKASLPDWSSEAAVYLAKPRLPDVGAVSAFATASGLPNQVLSGIQDVTSLQASWRDANNIQWSYDLPGQNLNWWKYVDWRVADETRPTQPPALDKARLLAVAEAFLNAHGLGAYARNGVVEEQPWMIPLMQGTPEATSMPCILEEEATMQGGAGTMTPADIPNPDAKTMIYPSPCGWWPQQVTVYFPETRDGRPVADAGGWPSRLANVTIDLSTYEVTGGNVMLSSEAVSSLYPLIDKEEAMKRLQSGGRNPVYPWGGEGGSIVVTIDKIEYGFMRHVAWNNDGRMAETYLIPALIASGAVDRKITGQEPEQYRTIIPLVTDDAFEGIDPQPVPQPVPLPAVDVAPAPAAEPKR